VTIDLHVPSEWDEWLAFFSASLPDPVRTEHRDDGAVVFTAGEPVEVVVRLTPRWIGVATVAVRRGAEGPRLVPLGAGRIRWPRLTPRRALAAVEALVGAARATRRARFASCDACDTLTPPESMTRDGICLRCAARERPVAE
jgi:hypothetical protein